MKKSVKESAVNDQTYKIFPNDLNSYGTAFGGMIMSILDRIACVVAERHSEQTCVTASVDSMHFRNPAKRGDILLFSASINRAWRTSMEIGVKVMAENYKTREKRHVLTAYLTFVAIDDVQKPTQVPEVVPKTALEKRRYREAELRREHRKKTAMALKAGRSAT